MTSLKGACCLDDKTRHIFGNSWRYISFVYLLWCHSKAKTYIFFLACLKIYKFHPCIILWRFEFFIDKVLLLLWDLKQNEHAFEFFFTLLQNETFCSFFNHLDLIKDSLHLNLKHSFRDHIQTKTQNSGACVKFSVPKCQGNWIIFR